MKGLCIAADLQGGARDAFMAAVRVHGPYEPGEYIYHRGSPLSGICAVKTGLVRTETVSEEGARFIGEFLHCGDLLALDAIDRGSYPSDAIAVQRTWVCELPLARLDAIGNAHPGLFRALLKRSSRHLDQSTMGTVERRAMLSHERIQYFLLDLYLRNGGCRQVASARLRLPMPKGDIATFLGLTPESFSRGLRKLQSGGMIRNYPRHIELKSKLLASVPFEAESGIGDPGYPNQAAA